MSKETKTERKDPIVIDDSLIGREVFFTNKTEYSYISPRVMYKVKGITNAGGLIISSNRDTDVWIRINDTCAHLKNKCGWLLAKRTSSKQQVVRTVSGRKL